MSIQQNRYELLERIGVGGMAEVFRARMVGPAGFQKVVALKRILEDYCADQDFIHRFVDEARITARLQHPNICQVLDFGVIDDRYYLTLEYVHGLDLAQVLGRLEYHGELLDPGLCLQVISGVLRGLAHAHRAIDEVGRSLGIVHRDVSPQNVLLSINGDIKLSDFGAAKADAAVRQARTQENIALGKLAYMAPEQRRGKSVDGRSDVYGVGVLMAEMLEGPTLFRRNTGLVGIDRERLAAAAKERFPATVAPQAAELLKKALDPHLERRYSDALSMLIEVEHCAVEMGVRSSTDQLGELVRQLVEDVEFINEPQHQNKLPHPVHVVTRSFTSERSQGPDSTVDDMDSASMDSFDEGSADSTEDSPDTRGIDSLEEMLDSADVVFAPTELAEGSPSSEVPTSSVEELATEVIRKKPSAGSDASTQLIRDRAAPRIDQVGTHLIPKEGPAFEELETQVIKGRKSPPKTLPELPGLMADEAAPISIDDFTPDLSDIDDGSAPTRPKLPGAEKRRATPPPTLPTVARVGADAGMVAREGEASEYIGPAPKSQHPAEAPEPKGAPLWNTPSSEVALDGAPPALDGAPPGQVVMLSPDEEDDPTHVDQAPSTWTAEARSFQEPKSDSHHEEALGPSTAAGRQATIASSSGPSRRSFRLVIIGLIIAICVALWSAFSLVGWLAERNRPPWPPEGSDSSGSTANTTPSLPVAATDTGAVESSGLDASTASPQSRNESPTLPVTAPQGDLSSTGAASMELEATSSKNPDALTRDASGRSPASQPRSTTSVGHESPRAQPNTAGPEKRPSKAAPARLTILSDPPGRAYIDGGLVGTRTPVRGHEIAPGQHLVRVVFSSTGASSSRSVTVAAGEHKTVTFAPGQ